MRRRDSLACLASAGTAAPWTALAPKAAWAQAARTVRLGLLGPSAPNPATSASWKAFFDELAERGWVVGRNLVVEGRYNAGSSLTDSALAADLLATQPDIVVAFSSASVEAARQATRTVPIVLTNVSHAVEVGFVASLARPGGNVTGVVNQAGDLTAKYIELLRELRPDLKRYGVIWHPGNPGSALGFRSADLAAAKAGIDHVSLPMNEAREFAATLALARREGVQALNVHPIPALAGQIRHIIPWALEHKVATLGQAPWVRAGFLLSYWAYTPDLHRTAARQVDRILRGASPAEMPVEQPTRFELVLNLKTARAIGARVPPTLLARADEVVE